jgi:guanine deaminase
MTVSLAVVGTVMQTPAPDAFEQLVDVVVAVDPDGFIMKIEPQSTDAGMVLMDVAGTLVELSDTEVLLPGLVDLHIHAPQWPQLGTCLDIPLEQWLFEYTFPLEARYADPAFAAMVWPDLVASQLRNGTTTAVYFVTNDQGATLALAAECLKQGQRAFIGRVAMDHPTGTPPWYRDEHAFAALDSTARSIESIRALDAGRDLVRPMVTPRFTPACTDDLLAGLGELAVDMAVAVQTHCSESDWAHAEAIRRFWVTDTAALDMFGLLRPGSILAHANHITDADADLIVRRGVGVAHCPLSNAYFADGVFPTRRMLDRGVRVGLGTDVAGGASAGVLGQCQQAVTMSRMLEAGVDVSRPTTERGVPDSRIDIVTAFWMATLGGAAALDLPVGLLEVGRRFDAFVVDTSPSASGMHIWSDLYGPEQTFEKIVRLAGPSQITSTWVNGRRATPAT